MNDICLLFSSALFAYILFALTFFNNIQAQSKKIKRPSEIKPAFD
ncbi:hypothetical protein BAXH7_02699 [Bacillus amyloliquefaciens XH7]|nr:hypothetical protein BAMTA208_13220 [Bacillus amyloliquefaciens TA208]AEB64305.1 hypothetical protein LL3_02773 [Bacillus amyloliquefaciens LL3]AEK89825.1 hypothetical protein BAXH7_02699 [Bacillus amyloliquefaciens XH7]